ncbi:major facilitator superfamily domain-containing protein [Daldinia sp. FL1419]|nr:major facilitator superfamily domain-containing protein [Daldinia sp. FL1419]
MSTDPTAQNNPPEPQQEPKRPGAQTHYVEGMPLALICVGLISAVFCIGLDRSIIATAIPKITNEFNSLDDVAWYGSAYLLTTCCFQLMFGKLYVEYQISWVFLAALGLFETGSLVSGCAPNSLALIIGRAIQGIGCAGVLSGALTILALSVPLHKRPMYTALISGASSIAQIIAPTLGGVFTDRATWRWCFWINLPLGAVSAVVVIFLVKLPSQQNVARSKGVRQVVEKFDLLGTVIFMPSIICLLLALEWGGLTYAWSNWRIILCLSLFGVSFIAWLYVQHVKGDRGTLPLRILKQRSVSGGLFYTFGRFASLYLVIYYTPIWFQAVKDTTAEQSGINFLASSGPMALTAVFSGILTTKSGYYIPQMYFSSAISSVASGLIYRYSLETSTAYWVGTLVMFGFGNGLGIQLPLTAVQTVLKGSDIPIGTSVIILFQTISGTIFLAVGQNLFQTKLVEAVTSSAPGVDASIVLDSGVTDLSSTIEGVYGPAAVTEVKVAYNSAIQQCYLVCVILSCVSMLGLLPMEWKNVKREHAKESAENSIPVMESSRSSWKRL